MAFSSQPLPLKRFGHACLFDPQGGQTVVEPPAAGQGSWCGAPSVVYDGSMGKFFVCYRIRRPRDYENEELRRGGELVIAESMDGIHFNTIWRANKKQFKSPSLERAALVKCLDDVYRLYFSYVDGDSRQWKIGSLAAASPHGFDPEQATPLSLNTNPHVSGVKDPFVFVLGGKYYMFVSYAWSDSGEKEGQDALHSTGDCFNTGLVTSRTGLCKSDDGITFTWQEGGRNILPNGAKNTDWDHFCTRLSCLIYTPPLFTLFYDGSNDPVSNYEERTGMAQALPDTLLKMQPFERASLQDPILQSPHWSGSLRYLDIVEFSDQLHFYYEYARADGSHELRMNVVDRSCACPG